MTVIPKGLEQKISVTIEVREMFKPDWLKQKIMRFDWLIPINGSRIEGGTNITLHTLVAFVDIYLSSMI